MALFRNNFRFLLKYTEEKYNIVLIIFELKILVILVLISPLAAEKETVNSSGTDVAIPVISPTYLGFKFNVSANFLNSFTKTYFDISTIARVNKMNLIFLMVQQIR